MPLWVVNVAAARDEPFRAILAHNNLTFSNISKTSLSNYAHVKQA